MDIRDARVRDAESICQRVNFYAERGKMLHRSLQSVYESLREFLGAEDDGKLVGCVAVDIFWSDLAEIKSLAVADASRGRGIGSALLEAAVQDARSYGVEKLFALTYEKGFFAAHGFSLIDRDELPEKVWRECFACDKLSCCDEIAMIRELNEDQERP